MSGPELPEYDYNRRHARPAVDPAIRRIALGAGGLTVAVMAVALLWSGIRPGAGFGPPPVILAPTTPLRIAPSDPGGITVPEADQQIMSGDAPDASPQLAPQGAGPAIGQLSQDAGGGAAATAPAPTPPAAPAALAGGSVAASVPATMPTATPAASAASPAAAPRDVQVQLAATVDETGVKKEWSRLQTKAAGVLQNHAPIFMPAHVDGQDIWRLRVGGFADRATAKQFCAAVIAKGGACTLADF